MSFTEIDLSLFKECANAMAFTDFLSVPDKIDMRASMSALDVGSPRLDAHVLAGGVLGVGDLEAHGIEFPNENVTADQIRKIQGNLFDALVARLDGQTVFQTIGVSVYVHKECELRNPLLKLAVLAHISLVNAVQDYALEKMGAGQSIWTIDKQNDFMHEFDVAELKKEIAATGDTGVADIVKWAAFELAFGEFLRGNEELPSVEEYPKLSEAIGVCNSLHYRDLSVSCPPAAIKIHEHEEAVKYFAQMYKDIKEALELPVYKRVLDLMEGMRAWQQSHLDALAFARVFMFSRVVTSPNTIAGVELVNFLEEELRELKVGAKALSLSDCQDFVPTIRAFLTMVVRGFVCPPCVTHHGMTKTWMKYFGYLRRYTGMVQGRMSKCQTFPRTNNEAMNVIVMSPLLYWAERIGIFLLISYVKYGFQNELYIPDDYGAVFLAMSTAYRSLTTVVQNERTALAVHRHQPPKKAGKKRIVRSGDVAAEISVKTPDELEIEMLMHFTEGAFHFMRFCAKTKSVKSRHCGFFDPEATYNSRMKPIQELGISVPSYDSFRVMNDTSNATAARLKADVTRKWNEAKALVTKASEARDGKTPFLTSVLRSIVVSSISMSRWQEGQMFNITIDDGIPCFQLE